jgi:hypothetical protein
MPLNGCGFTAIQSRRTIVAHIKSQVVTLRMNRTFSRLTRTLNIALTVVILAMTGACSPGPRWSQDEIENSKHYFRSLEANQKAAELTRKNDPDVPQFGIEQINKYQMSALSEARLVLDPVLDKANPELKEHFRSEYQKGLESILSSYAVGAASDSGAPSGGQIDRQAAGVRLLRQWNDWLSAHSGDIRMPDPAVAAK